ncbi:hypothetical protein [Mucilaginibacter flavus]|uniref:hypothetical protein n=1 Tax=Mucilaginibacter flavus TaxID=931504 RepID=UPI0025B4C72A|nr:hypothetical protein [Mucilaginibacter flavus]MDN3582651.1 hypothetical protein [Mucilaginibacter flavus]
MLKSEKYEHTKMSVKQYILALTLLLSFFATVGRVSNGEKVIGVVNTEVLTTRPSVFKNGVGFRRALIALDKRGACFSTPKESPVWALVLFSAIVTSRCIHLNLLFNSYKSTLQLKMMSPAHFYRLYFSTIG